LTQKVSLGSDFPQRLLTAAVGGPLIILILALGAPFTDLLAIGVGAITSFELWNMFRPASRLGLFTVLSVTMACIGSVFTAHYELLPVVLLVCLAIGGIDAWREPHHRGRFYVRSYVYTILGAAYLGVPLGLFILLRNMNNGFLWTGILFANSWCTDGFALIGGRIAGRHKLAPSISPGKTIEGAAAGISVGTLVGFGLMLAVRLTPTPTFPALVALGVNLLLALLTVLGDLFESWLKRTFHVKDAGDILPGHGGFLDRLDGFLFAIPAYYVVLLLLHV